MQLDLSHKETSRVAYKGQLSKYADSCGWVLCIGAGTSNSIFPCWNDLATDLRSLTKLRCSHEQVSDFIQSFGPEALMQAAANLLNKESLDEIPKHLSDTLYKGLRKKAGVGWPTIAKALTSSKPFNLTRDQWREFEQLTSSFKKASAPSIAKAIAEVADTERRPEAIISFNAEPLLYALINCYYGILNPSAVKDSGVKILDRLSHDLV